MFQGRTYYKLLEEEFPGLPLDVSWLELSTRFSIDQKMLQLFFFNEFRLTTCLDTRQPGTVFKKLDTRQSEILTNFLEIARLIPPRT